MTFVLYCEGVRLFTADAVLPLNAAACATIVVFIEALTGGRKMTGVWITLALGACIIIFEYRAETKPEPKDKRGRSRPLPSQAKINLRQLFFGTLCAAGFVWVIGQMFD